MSIKLIDYLTKTETHFHRIIFPCWQIAYIWAKLLILRPLAFRTHILLSHSPEKHSLFLRFVLTKDNGLTFAYQQNGCLTWGSYHQVVYKVWLEGGGKDMANEYKAGRTFQDFKGLFEVELIWRVKDGLLNVFLFYLKNTSIYISLNNNNSTKANQALCH